MYKYDTYRFDQWILHRPMDTNMTSRGQKLSQTRLNQYVNELRRLGRQTLKRSDSLTILTIIHHLPQPCRQLAVQNLSQLISQPWLSIPLRALVEPHPKVCQCGSLRIRHDVIELFPW